MRKFLDYMKAPFSNKRQAAGIILNTGILGGAYYIISNYTPGWISYGLIVLPCIVILLTAIARVNDISASINGWRWHLRKLGFIMSGTASAAYLSIPFTAHTYWPTWNAVMLSWGVAAAFITTPGMIPWWRYITGEFRKKDLVKMAAGEKVDGLNH